MIPVHQLSLPTRFRRAASRRWIVRGLVGCTALLGASLVATGLIDARAIGLPPIAPPIGVSPGHHHRRRSLRPEVIHFYSRALRREADYLVYLPAAWSPARHLPAFYMLHGMPGRPMAFTVNAGIEPRINRMIRHGRVQPMILVFPDGRIDGHTASDSEWANTSYGDYDSYVADVVRDVDARFGALPDRDDRAIAGLSAGAYGAMNVALHHLNLFGAVEVWSGYFTQTETGVFAHASTAELDNNSPLDLARQLAHRLRRYPIRVFLYVGHGDRDAPQLLPMAEELKAEGVDVQWAIYPGFHNWNLWSKHLPQMLKLASHELTRPPVGLPASVVHARHAADRRVRRS